MQNSIDLTAQIETLAGAEHFAASQGVKLSPNDRENIQRIQEAELQRLAKIASLPIVSAESNFNQRYVHFLEAITGIGNIILTLSQTIILSFGIPAVVLLLLIVEQQRVVHGIQLFESDFALASFASSSLVLLNLVLEFQIHYIEQKEIYKSARQKSFSLRIWLQDISYRLGIAQNWRPRELSPAARYKSLLRLVTVSILALALAGSMRAIIQEISGSWFQALVYIVTQSNLSKMMTWLGGLLFAGAAVLSAQGLSRYVALRTVEILDEIKAIQTQEQNELSNSIEQVAVHYVLSKVATVQHKHKNPNLLEGEESNGLPLDLNQK